jgi:hypothetical protein
LRCGPGCAAALETLKPPGPLVGESGVLGGYPAVQDGFRPKTTVHVIPPA